MRCGFSPVLRDERCTCSRTICPISRITESNVLECRPMGARGWARCTNDVADVLRRGAWYPIVEEGDDDQVVLDVRGRSVRFSRADLTLRSAPPDTWSIVVRM